MKTVALLATAIAALAVASNDGAEPPAQKPVAAVIQDDLLARFDSEPLIDFETYLRAHWSGFSPVEVSSLGDEFADRRAQSGGYELVEVKTSTDTLAEEVVKAKLSDDYFLSRLEVGAGPDRPIRNLSFQPIARPADVSAPNRVPAAELAHEIDAELAAIGDFSGAALVAENGRVIYSHAEGFADQGQRLPNTLETRFRMASMSKMFTGVSILQLNQAGKLDLDGTVGSILKDYPNAEFASSVTVRELLTHTGGAAGDSIAQAAADNIDRLKTPADYIALFGNRPPEFKPGSRFSYANYGYVVLQRIVEVVSGQTYADYLRDHVFGPAGMVHTGPNKADQPTLLATPYVKTQHGDRSPRPGFLRGEIYTTTVGDLVAFAGALTDGRLLDQAHIELLFSPRVAFPGLPGASYAYGFEVWSADGIDDVGHDGGAPGMNGGFRILDRGRAVVAVLSNVAPTWRADKLCEFIAARLRLD